MKRPREIDNFPKGMVKFHQHHLLEAYDACGLQTNILSNAHYREQLLVILVTKKKLEF